jgi:hypothetical protein
MEAIAHVISTIVYRPIFRAELESGLRRGIGHRDSEILHLYGTHLCIFLLCCNVSPRAASDARANGGRQSIDQALTLPYIVVTKDGALTLFWL